MQLAVADVERDHARGAALEEHVGEAARRRADVEAVEPRGVDARSHRARSRASRRRARRTAAVSVDHELDVFVHLLAGLRVPRHEAGEDERLGLRAALRQPTLDEQDVEALLRHGYAVRTTSPLTISVSTEVSAGISSSIASARSPARSAS